MKRLWPLLALLAAAAVAILVLDPFSKPATVAIDDATHTEREAPVAPNLAAAPRGAAKSKPSEPSEPGGQGAPEAPPAPTGSAISGFVIDDATGTPLPGARVGVEPPGPTRRECPRLPAGMDRWRYSSDGDAGGYSKEWEFIAQNSTGLTSQSAGTTSGTDGSFRIPWDFPSTGDLFARAPGYVLACVCGVGPSSPVTVRLMRGAEIRGRIVQADGQPIEGATIDARPGPGTPNLPGHVERAKSGKDGAFVVTGLLLGAVVLTVDHPKFVAVTLEPMEPGGAPMRIVLLPALVTTFKITTDNGKEPQTPSLAWTTSSTPPKSGLLILTHRNPAPPDAADPAGAPTAQDFGPVKIPCDAPDATFEVKAIGYSPWKSEPVPLPPEGGERTVEVRLDRDLTLGSLKLTFEDRDGKALSYTEEKMEAHLWRRDNRPVPAGIVLLTTETLNLPALPAGPYGVLVRSPGHAPAIVTADVVAGLDGEQRVVLAPPAKVRVKFTAAETILVQFRVLWNDQVAYPYPENAATVSQSADAAGAPVFHAGGEGLVLSGLAAGRHVIQVISPDLVSSSTPVDLVEGETREIEIAVTKR